MKDDEINVCLTADNNYSIHMYITVFSLLYNLDKKRICNVYILDYMLSDENKEKFYSLEKKFLNFKILFIPVNEKYYRKYPPFGGYWNTYFRLDIPQLLPHIDKVLYLDPDIVVNSDISDMYDIDIDGFAIGAPTETGRWSFINRVILKIPFEYGYFNAGVLLMNLSYFRKNSISNQLFDYLLNAKDIICCDQDALNFVLYDKRKALSWIYNVTPHMLYSHLFSRGKSAIIHFCGKYKPWGRYCTHPYRRLYRRYRLLSGLDSIKKESFSVKKMFVSIIMGIEDVVQAFFPFILYVLLYVFYRIKIGCIKLLKYEDKMNKS